MCLIAPGRTGGTIEAASCDLVYQFGNADEIWRVSRYRFTSMKNGCSISHMLPGSIDLICDD